MILDILRVITMSGFNRTFMELKYTRVMTNNELVKCFNRTFMELKLRKSPLSFGILAVLIVPLWN